MPRLSQNPFYTSFIDCVIPAIDHSFSRLPPKVFVNLPAGTSSMAEKRVAQIAGHLFPKGMLAGQVAIITGSGQGIGAEAAHLFAQEGAKVVVQDIDAGTSPSSCRTVS